MLQRSYKLVRHSLTSCVIMVLLENEAFLTELTKFFIRARTNGSIRMTMKKYDGVTKAKPKGFDQSQQEAADFSCLLRAYVKNKKISTVVHPKEVNKFLLAFGNALKGNMDGLKKLKKSKAKSKAAQ